MGDRQRPFQDWDGRGKTGWVAFLLRLMADDADRDEIRDRPDIDDAYSGVLTWKHRYYRDAHLRIDCLCAYHGDRDCQIYISPRIDISIRD